MYEIIDSINEDDIKDYIKRYLQNQAPIVEVQNNTDKRRVGTVYIKPNEQTFSGNDTPAGISYNDDICLSNVDCCNDECCDNIDLSGCCF